jgi:energy-coupling factor transporter ATP-binding protein EcfA2
MASDMERQAESGNQTKLQQFCAVTIAHPHLIAAKERLTEILADAPRNSVVFVLGPTGVGKSTLRAKVDNELRSVLAGELQADRGRLPVLSVEAEAPDTGIFNWRDHFKRLLEAAREPLIDYKLDRNGTRRGHGVPAFQFECGPRASGSEYQYSVEQAIRFRRPQAVLIDEAQHLTKMSSGRRLIDQLDVIKSIANHTATPHVLFGTYDLLAFRNLNGQLSRRSFCIHFGRYHADRPNEAAIFVNVVRSFCGHLPLKAGDDLTKDWEFLYERSVGCVGILKDWLVQALSVMVRRGGVHLERRDFEATALSVSQCDKILSECIEGEMRLDESEERHLHLRARMGLQTVGPGEMPNHPNSTSAQMRSRVGQNRRPGQRRATRDPIGSEAMACGT